MSFDALSKRGLLSEGQLTSHLYALRGMCSRGTMTDGVKGTVFIAHSPLFVLFPLSPPPLSQVGLAVFGYEGTPLCNKLLLALCQAWSGSDKPRPVSQLPGLSDPLVGSLCWLPSWIVLWWLLLVHS